MGYKVDRQKGPEAPTLFVANHSTNLDPALVGMGFSRHMYYLASEHAFRNGLPSKILKFVFDPIPINKAKTDVTAIKEMLRRLKAGANVCLFPEGDRSFTGSSAPMTISIAKLAKSSGADMITFRIEGGFFTGPRWSSKMRKGEMFGRMMNSYSAERLRKMTDQQVLEAIESDLYEDAYERQKVKLVRYRGKNLAESLETVLFLCPQCNKIGTIKSEGCRFSCPCGLSGVYTETGFLEGQSIPFSTITEWGGWQDGQLGELIANAGSGPICSDEAQQLFEVQPAVSIKLVGEGALFISKEEIHCAGMTFPLEEVSRVTVVGQMKLLISLKNGTTYEVRSAVPRSALKYRDIFRELTES